MELHPAYISYFNRGQYENPRFWARFGYKPDFTGATVLDIGCGHGSLCIHIAHAGATKVVGLDINSDLIEFANANLTQNFPDVKDVVEFSDVELKDYPPGPQFDYIVSKNAFEHVIGLDQLIAEAVKRLKPDGQIYAGFGPLYQSPFGFHGHGARGIVSWPWEHMLLGEKRLLARAQHLYGHERTLRTIYDLGMNKLTPREYVRIFTAAGLSIVLLRFNRPRDKTPLVTLVTAFFSLCRRIPFLENLFTFNIYCVLQKNHISPHS